MTAAERTVLDTLLPSGAHPGMTLGLFDAGFDEFYADFQRSAALSMRLGFKTALFAALWAAPLLIGRLPPLTRHDRETRERALEALGRSRVYVLRQMLLLLKAVACLCYGAHPRVRETLGCPTA